MEAIDPSTIDKLLDYGLAITIFVFVLWGFFTDRLSSGKSRDREVSRERELTDRALGTMDKLSDSMDKLADAWEQRNAVDSEVRRATTTRAKAGSR